MQKWEYLTLQMWIEYKLLPGLIPKYKRTLFWTDDAKDSRSLQERLNALGRDGWELVNTYTIADYPGEVWSGVTSSIQLVLKRTVE